MIASKTAALFYRLIALFVSFFSVLSNCGLFNGTWNPVNFLYYTIWSNIFAFFLFLYLVIKTWKDIKQNRPFGFASYKVNIHMAVTLAITLTLIVYWVMLAPSFGFSQHMLAFSNLGAHLITPLLTIGDYLLFCKSGVLKKRDAVFCGLPPVIYFAFAILTGFSNKVHFHRGDDEISRFPYFFIDFDMIGVKVFFWVVIIAATYFAAAFGLYYLDRKWEKPILYPKQEVND